MSYTIQEATTLIYNFEHCTLPKGDWTHEAHLIGGLYFLAKYGDHAIDNIRECIKAFNVSVGGQNTDTSGYHETLTRFWLWAVKNTFADQERIVFDQNSLDTLLWDEDLANRNLWLSFYSKDLMLSTAARLNYVSPDLKPLS